MNRKWFESRPGYPIGIPISKLSESIDSLEDFLGYHWVKTQIQTYEAWRLENSIKSLWNHRPTDTNPLIPMFKVFKDWNSHGRTSTQVPVAVIDLASIAGYIFCFKSYWSQLPEDRGTNHIKAYLKNTETCRGMLYELASAFHYMNAGYTPVTPLFMNPDNYDKADILIAWQGTEIEVHCKSKVPGAGQKIHTDLFDYLAGCTLSYCEKYTYKSLWVKLVCDNELKIKDVEYLRERICALIKTGLVGEFPLNGNNYVLRIKEIKIPIGGVPKSEVMKLHKPMYRAILADSSPILINKDSYYKVCLFDAISHKRPKVASSLKRSIRDAKIQATGVRPSIVTVHFYDPMHWEMVNKSDPFESFIDQQLKTKAGTNIGALVLTGEPFTANRWTGDVFAKNLPALWYINPHANLKTKLPPGFQLSGQTIHDG